MQGRKYFGLFLIILGLCYPSATLFSVLLKNGLREAMMNAHGIIYNHKHQLIILTRIKSEMKKILKRLERAARSKGLGINEKNSTTECTSLKVQKDKTKKTLIFEKNERLIKRNKSAGSLLIVKAKERIYKTVLRLTATNCGF